MSTDALMVELSAAKAELRREVIGGRKDQLRASRADVVIQRYQRALKAVARQRYRKEGLLEAADFIDNDDTCACGGCDTCVPRKFATDLRRMASQSEKASPAVDEWVRCGHSHCPNAERFQYAEQRGWTPGGMGTWCCPQHPAPARP